MLKRLNTSASGPAATPLVDLESERAALGCLLADNNLIDGIDLVSSDFFDPLHAEVFEVIKRLRGDGRNVNSVTIGPYFVGRPPVGGVAIPNIIASLRGDVTSPGDAGDFADQVRDVAMRRDLAALATQTVTLAGDRGLTTGDVATAMVASVDRIVVRSGGQNNGRLLADVADEVITDIGTPDAQGKVNLRMPSLANLMKAPLPGQNIVLAGATGAGKTNFAIQFLIGGARSGARCAFVAQEMSARELVPRFLSNLTRVAGAGIPHSEIMGIPRSDAERMRRISDAGTELRDLRIDIQDRPGMSIAEISTYLRCAERRASTKIDMLVVDYMGLLKSEGHQNDLTAQATEISRSLKLLARRHDVVLINLHQLNRKFSDRPDQRPTKHDLRQSGQIENDADKILLVHYQADLIRKQIEALNPSAISNPSQRADVEKEVAELERAHRKMVNVTEVIVDKNRQGPTGAVKLYYDVACSYICCQARVN